MAGKGISRRDVLKAASAAPLSALLAAYLDGGQTIEEKKKLNRELIVRTLTDPTFRRQLETSPATALKKQPTAQNLLEIKKLLETVKQLEARIHALADELLCANGGCSIARR